MELRIVIDVPKGGRRRVLMFVVMPLALVAVVGAAAYAAQQNLDTTWVTPNQPVSASALSADLNNANANFTELYGRVAALESFKNQATADGGYSLGATYCGLTAATKGAFSGPGLLTGYASARAQCQGVPGCSATAGHMCTADEVERSKQLGIAIVPGGWYSTAYSVANGYVGDCSSWLSAASGDYGAVWSSETPGASACASASPILCCN